LTPLPRGHRFQPHVGMMNRRTFLCGLTLGALSGPLGAAAQPAVKMPRVGVLAPGNPPLVHADAFRQGLRDLGYVEGHNIILEWRWGAGNPDQYSKYATELVRLGVDIIVAGTTPASLAAKQVTQTTPIVMAAVADPIGSGLVRQLSKPGGNITGMSLLSPELSAKRVEVLTPIRK
jgi:putative tryptophan/tyrosine transport system substrate-binding protein